MIDIGSWTIDILPFIEGQPDLSKCKSLSMSTITTMIEINEALRQKFDEEAQVMSTESFEIVRIRYDLKSRNGANSTEEFCEVIEEYVKQNIVVRRY